MRIGEVELVLPEFDDSELEETKKKMNALFGSVEGTYPMNRFFGINSEVFDYPIQSAKTMLAADMYEKAERFLPGIRIVDIEFRADFDNEILYPIIRYEIVETEDDTELSDDAEDSEEDEYESN